MIPNQLAGREARCCHCNRTVPSDPALPFFEYRGPGSDRAMRTCRHCRYGPEAHERKREFREAHLARVCDAFEPLRDGYPYDDHYDGCRGWD